LQLLAHILHPVIVTALDSGLAARLFGLAFAAGWVQEAQDRVVLSVPGLQEISVIIPDAENAPGQISAYVLGFVRMVNLLSVEQIQALQKAISQMDITPWRAWTTANWREAPGARAVMSTPAPANEDFALVVALIVRDEVIRRVKSESQSG